MNNEENKKSLDSFKNDAVDGNDVKGGFGPGMPFNPNPAPDMLPDGPPINDGLGGPPNGGDFPNDPANNGDLPIMPEGPGQMPNPGGPLMPPRP